MDQSLFAIKNIQTLVETFKIKNCIYPAMVSDTFLSGTEIITAFIPTRIVLMNQIAHLYTVNRTVRT